MRKRTHSRTMRLLLITVGILALVLGLATMAGAAGPPGPPDGVGPPPGTPGLDRAAQVADEHAKELLDILGVEGVGVGLTGDGRPAVVVFTESAGIAVSATLDGVPVVVVVTGKFRALAPPPPQASFTYSCSGLTCTFDGSSSIGRRLSFAWDFGDGAVESGKVVTHTYAAAGTYTVSLTVTDKDGATYTTSQAVTVSDGGGGGGGLPDCVATNQTTVKCQRPVPIGISTGHPAITAGTIGARVVDGAGNVYALSNNHVYANENLASIGDNVLQPGAYDGGVSPDDAIGTLFAFKSIIFNNTGTCTGGVSDPDCNIIDAAIATTTTGNLNNRTVSAGYGVPKSAVVSPSLSYGVQKCGRTTGCTSGRIYAIHATVDVGYDGGTARFVDQIVVVSGGFSAGGDSGSLVVVKGRSANKKPVGLLFAGSVNATIINPIGPVLGFFGVSIDGE